MLSVIFFNRSTNKTCDILMIQAKTADDFRKVDYGYIKASADVAKAVGISHYSLLTSVGANPNIWASDLASIIVLFWIQLCIC